ncbi:MAG: P1 family peptidase [Thermomicrobiales bacterium]|nr:P1 family peptidase [Thermomicrobiales bacterium]
MPESPSRPRVRELGLQPGELEPGPLNAITDVAGVRVGQTTVWWGDGPLRPGHGPARTGVTAVLPHPGNLFQAKVPAAFHVINGFGKSIGGDQITELGTIETPIALTSTLAVGRVADALISHAIRENPGIGISTSTVNPVVGECNDGWLNDIQGRHVTEQDVLAAIDGATAGPVAEGAVGAGTGMRSYGFKAGIGTASRLTPDQLGGWTVGVLVLANFGAAGQLVVDGAHVGRALDAERGRQPEQGSIVTVVATDAPLLDRGLGRLARRVALGLARTGSTGGHGSGEVAIAFSTAPGLRVPHEPPRPLLLREILADDDRGNHPGQIDALFQAVVEATEEAVLNSLFRAKTVTGRDGNTSHALPLDRVHEAVLPRLVNR